MKDFARRHVSDVWLGIVGITWGWDVGRAALTGHYARLYHQIWASGLLWCVAMLPVGIITVFGRWTKVCPEDFAALLDRIERQPKTALLFAGTVFAVALVWVLLVVSVLSVIH